MQIKSLSKTEAIEFYNRYSAKIYPNDVTKQKTMIGTLENCRVDAINLFYYPDRIEISMLNRHYIFCYFLNILDMKLIDRKIKIRNIQNF